MEPYSSHSKLWTLFPLQLLFNIRTVLPDHVEELVKSYRCKILGKNETFRVRLSSRPSAWIKLQLKAKVCFKFLVLKKEFFCHLVKLI